MMEIKAIQKIKLEGVAYSDAVSVLNDLIPKEGVATNYKVNCEDSMGGRCIH